ncbi:MAG: M48 family metallopeptidase [Lachnospiraceae bacterium]
MEMEIEIRRKHIKNIYLRILPPDGRVQVTTPFNMKEDAIWELVASKAEWIARQQARLLEDQSRWQQEETLSDKEPVWVWGEQIPLQIEEWKGRPEVRIGENRLIMKIHPDSTVEERKKVLEQWYREQLADRIPEVLERCEKRVGRQAAQWRLRNMKTRWGSCNIREARICLNTKLAKKPPQCLEYVITHELVHLYEGSHNARFWELMTRFYPQWKSARKRLNQRDFPMDV